MIPDHNIFEKVTANFSEGTREGCKKGLGAAGSEAARRSGLPPAQLLTGGRSRAGRAPFYPLYGWLERQWMAVRCSVARPHARQRERGGAWNVRCRARKCHWPLFASLTQLRGSLPRLNSCVFSSTSKIHLTFGRPDLCKQSMRVPLSG